MTLVLAPQEVSWRRSALPLFSNQHKDWSATAYISLRLVRSRFSLHLVCSRFSSLIFLLLFVSCMYIFLIFFVDHCLSNLSVSHMHTRMCSHCTMALRYIHLKMSSLSISLLTTTVSRRQMSSRPPLSRPPLSKQSLSSNKSHVSKHLLISFSLYFLCLWGCS